MTAHL